MTIINTKRLRALGVLASLTLAACSGSGTSPVSVTQQNLGADVLQLAVGTANIYGSPSGPNGLNVVVTYRQPSGALAPGDSAVAVSTPTFSGPAALPGTAGSTGSLFSTIETGPAPGELGTHSMTGTSQTGSTPTTFGRSGGAFGLGIEPFNYNGNGSVDSIAPYKIPLYDPGNCSSSSCSGSGDANALVPWGGPPAFPNQRNASNAGQLGISEGLDVFANMVPKSGSYTLSVSIPANTGAFTQGTNANLPSPSFLLPIVNPNTPSLDGNGGGTFSASLAAGVTEAYIQITDLGPSGASSSTASCNGSGPGNPTYYTIFLHRGASSGKLTDALGPGGSPSLCTSAQNSASSSGVSGDIFTVQVLAFDYPIYEASYPKSNGNPKPNILGGSGQDDISISPALTCTQAASGGMTCAGSSSSGAHPLQRPSVR